MAVVPYEKFSGELMDFDSIHACNAVVTQCVQQQQVSAAGAAPPGVTASGALAALSAGQRAAQQPAGFAARRATTFQDLPPEIIRQIATYTPFDDIGSLSSTTRRTYYALWHVRRSWLCHQRADNVHQLDLRSTQELLDEIERIGESRLGATSLEVLWPRIPELPRQYRAQAYKRIFDMAGRVPTHAGLPIRKGMIGTIPGLPAEDQLPMYDFVHVAIEKSGAGHDPLWASLAWLLRCLPLDPPRFEREYSAFVSRLASLDVPAQSELIEQLVTLLPGFCEDDPAESATLARYHRLMQDWVQRLPRSYQGAPIGALAHMIWLLPAQHMPAHYMQLRSLAEALPDDQLGPVLRRLPTALVLLPQQYHAAEFALLEPLARRVRPDQYEAAVVGLLESTVGLDDTTLSRSVWRNALQLLDGCDDACLFNVVDELVYQQLVPLLSIQQWEGAKSELLAFIERNPLSDAARTKLLDFISMTGPKDE
ncbi:F-box domain-containing protein [Mycetohabitans sp. B8]|uniref:F-box domain-containing protein n=1 Tax=Mycetohabitans sp. B8 TaxID=2841845 RepID=UPI001F417A9B|nr:F-box domain-containing protein [Mycetohabitans sp. B8]MCG1043242.1 F-box domain-containing protein [Mycetohabitans sp. B8]